MEKMLKVPLMMLAITLSIFLVAGHANAAGCCCGVGGCPSCPDTNGDGVNDCVAGTNGWCYGCGSVVTASCTFEDDLVCASSHGLIVGAAGTQANPLVIDGADYCLDGGDTPIAQRHCEVLVDGENWCADHPCRCADINGNAVCDGCTDSGILNVDPAQAQGLDGPNCQGGFDFVTVKNLNIQHWCNGIVMSGENDTDPETVGDQEDRLIGLLIEGNCIQDCGGGDCGSYTPGPGEGGVWENRFYNDAIFLAQVGLENEENKENQPPFAKCKMANPLFPLFPTTVPPFLYYPDLVECGPPNQTTTCECTPKPACQPLGCECCRPLPFARNIVRSNMIQRQTGCGAISCPGGNGINLNGGLEEPIGEDGEVRAIWWSGANEIAKNLIRDCAFSGIMYQHATTYNRIHGNVLESNLFCGITDPCVWCNDNYIYVNIAKNNYGTGIAINASAQIDNNYCGYTRKIPADSPIRDMVEYQTAMNGHGIMVGGDEEFNSAFVLLGNTCCANESADIVTAGAPGVVYDGDQNKCDTAVNYTDSTPGNPNTDCRYGCCGYSINLCSADLNHDCIVGGSDWAIMWDEWTSRTGSPACCP